MSVGQISHTGSSGTKFVSLNGDLHQGVDVYNPWGTTLERQCADFGQFAAWHLINVHPRLKSFRGYDAIQYNFKDENKLQAENNRLRRALQDITDLDLVGREIAMGALNYGN